MPEKIDTTHVLMDNELVLYRRSHSTIWQCRYKVDSVWQRASTKERDEKKARKAAKDLMIEAEIRKKANLPVVTRKFRHVAKLAIDSMDKELAAGNGKVSYADYTRVINEYLIPHLGNFNVASVSHAVLKQFDEDRIAQMGKAPAQSTMMTHNAALNRVFDEAVDRGFITQSSRPKLLARGKSSDRRPAFELNEVHALMAGFEAWIASARNEQSRELRALLADYVEVLLDTGARPGDELLNLKWKQIKYNTKFEFVDTGRVDESEPWNGESDKILQPNFNRSCEMVVSGKTGERTILGMDPTIKAMARIIVRNYGIKNKYGEPLKGVAVATNDDYVFRTKGKEKPTSFQKMFEGYLREHSLLIDPKTEQKRVFYSLRHTYATLALTIDRVEIHTLAKQMGTSVQMIERHYSHLDVVKAIEQLRGEETRRLIRAGSVIDQMYFSKKKPGNKTKAKEV